jgi:DNA-binding NarL/FixJ family response regulator
MQRPFETVIVERNALLREGLTRLLDSSQFRTVASVSQLDDVVLGSLAKEASILLLLGLGEDVKSGIRVIEYFKEQQPTGRVVVLAERSDVDEAISAFRAGANAYLAEVTSCDALIKSLELVMLGETIFPFPMLSTLLDHSRFSREPEVGRAIEFDYNDAPTLSAREKCILSCLANGSPNKLIARQINVAEATVKVHVKAILRKIRVQNRTQAALWAMRHRGITSGLENGSSAPAKLSQGVTRSFARNVASTT